MAYACTIKSPFAKGSGMSREALGREREKSIRPNGLAADAEFPERFATLAKCSGKIAQALGPSTSLAAFGNDSRDESFFYSAAWSFSPFGTCAAAALTRGLVVTLSASAASAFSMIFAMIAWPARSNTPRFTWRYFSDSRSLVT